MPAGVLAVVVWTCVGLFVGVVLLGFAALAGIWQPRDEETGKWLKRSVVFPLVGGVVGFATFVFASERGLPPQPTPTPEPSPFVSPGPHPSRTDAPPGPPPAPTATPTPVPTRTPVPDDPRPPVARCGVAVPRRWPTGRATIWASRPTSPAQSSNPIRSALPPCRDDHGPKSPAWLRGNAAMTWPRFAAPSWRRSMAQRLRTRSIWTIRSSPCARASPTTRRTGMIMSLPKSAG